MREDAALRRARAANRRTTARVHAYLFGGGDRDASRYRVVEVASVVAYVWIGGAIAADVVEGLATRSSARWLAAPVALAGYLAADFASGLVHWLADTYASATTPFVGPKFVRPFREHHRDPLAITRHDFVEANGDNCLVSQLVLLPTYLFCPTRSETWGVALGIFTLVLSAGVLLTSIAHGWAHMPEPPRIARTLQRLGLVLSPEHHAVHHDKPHHRRYCITTGWLNPALDRARFFRALERLFDRIGIPRGDVEDAAKRELE